MSEGIEQRLRTLAHTEITQIWTTKLASSEATWWILLREWENKTFWSSLVDSRNSSVYVPWWANYLATFSNFLLVIISSSSIIQYRTFLPTFCWFTCVKVHKQVLENRPGSDASLAKRNTWDDKTVMICKLTICACSAHSQPTTTQNDCLI